jgi:hypothetical protein
MSLCSFNRQTIKRFPRIALLSVAEGIIPSEKTNDISYADEDMAIDIIRILNTFC